MALFKILSNFPNGTAGITTTEQSNITTSLPTKANQGYCYFDVKTGKWWVDIAGDGSTNAKAITDISSNDNSTKFNRMPLNAYKADLADVAILARAAEHDGLGNTISETYAANIGFDPSTNKLRLYNVNDNFVSNAVSPIPYIVGPSTDTTAGTWTGSFNGLGNYTPGLIILYQPSVAGASTTTLNINSKGAKTVYRNYTSKLTTHYPKGQPILLVYSEQNSGCWMCIDDYHSDSNTVPSAYCSTGATTAAKTATCTNYKLLSNSYVHLIVTTTNTQKAALTLNINSQGAKPIYLNGVPTSATNYNLQAGTYLVYYDGTNYYIRDDGILPGKIERAVADSNGNTIHNTYATKEELNNIIALADAMVFKGVIEGGTTSPGNYTPAADCGYVYKVSTAGYINGIPVEVGDLLICTTDNTNKATSSNYSTIKNNWVIVQNNIDGAVFKGTNSFVSNHVIVADGTNGKVKDSGFTIASNVPANAVFTDNDTTYDFASGNTGNFFVTPVNGSAQEISIGKPATAGIADSANKLNTNAGSNKKPVYFSGGIPVAINYTIESNVPANAVFTDNNTTYDFISGTDGSFTVTPSGGSDQKVSIGKPATAGTADSANKLNSNAGNSKKPVYFSNGVPVAIGYTIESNVPPNAVFTDNDTKYDFTKGIGGFTVTPQNGSDIFISTGKYWADQEINEVSSKETTPTFKTASFIETTATATKNATLQYNSVTETLNFVFT